MINIITGGGGFIGSHLCERLLGDGQRVICIDNFITGDRRNIEGFLAESDAANSSNFSLIEHDITEPLPINDLRGIIGDESEIRIYNLACPASPIDYQNIPLETLWVSAMGTKNMLELAAQIGARFLHTSTSEVYGDPLENPQKESYFGNVNCIGPRSCYDEGKRFAESLIVNYRNIKGVDTRIVRIFNTYGPKMRANDGRVMPNFINQALEGKDITVYGDGKQTRSFCYVDDMVDGIISLMNHDEFGGPVNIGNPNERTILELAEMILGIVGGDSKIAHKDMPVDDPKVRCPDIGLAEKELVFEAKVGLDEGIKKTIEWFKR